MTPRDNSSSDCTAFPNRIPVLIPEYFRIEFHFGFQTLVLFDKLEVVLMAQEKTLKIAQGKLELAERNLKNQKTYYSLLRMEKEGRPLPSQVEEEVHSLGTDFSRNSRKFVLGTTAVGLGAVGVGVMAQNSANPNPNDSFDPHSDHKAVEPPKLGQATNELVEEPVKQSVVEPVQQPVVEPVEQPVKHVKQPVQRVEEPVKQPVVEQFTLPI